MTSLEPLKQARLASRDVMLSTRNSGSGLQEVFTLGDGCWWPISNRFFQGGPGSVQVRLRFMHRMVRAVPVLGSDGSSLERAFAVAKVFSTEAF